MISGRSYPWTESRTANHQRRNGGAENACPSIQMAVARLGERYAEHVVRKTTSVLAPTAATATNQEALHKEEEAKAEAEEEAETRDKAVANKAKTKDSPACLNRHPKQCSERRGKTG